MSGKKVYIVSLPAFFIILPSKQSHSFILAQEAGPSFSVCDHFHSFQQQYFDSARALVLSRLLEFQRSPCPLLKYSLWPRLPFFSVAPLLMAMFLALSLMALTTKATTRTSSTCNLLPPLLGGQIQRTSATASSTIIPRPTSSAILVRHQVKPMLQSQQVAKLSSNGLHGLSLTMVL